MKKLVLPVSIFALALFLLQSFLPLPAKARATARHAATDPATTPLACFSQEISIHAARRGNPFINLSDGRELLTGYEGDSQAVSALQQNRARGQSLASDDFDEDGTKDLVCGFANTDGSGTVTLHRGNVDSIYPNSPEAKLRRERGEFTDAPFLAPARVFEIPEAPEFMGAGDFDADGHFDAVAASSTGEALYLLKGDGRGGLGLPERIGLPGRVTAMTVGEINRADSLTDVVVGVIGNYGPQVLIFQSFDGALRSEPEAIIMPAEATSLAIGQLDDSYEYDLAIAAGNELLMVKGRSRLTGEAAPSIMSLRIFPFSISAIAIGEFIWEGSFRPDISVLAEDGRVQYLRRGDDWQVMNELRVAEIAPQSVPATRPALAKVKVSSLATDDLVVINGASSQVRIVSGGPGSKRALHEMTSLDMVGEARAVLPMRLNADALSDLVILRGNPNALTVAMTRPMATFSVTNTLNEGLGSLHQAIIDANDAPGVDMITFDISPGGQQTIESTLFFDEITEAVVIDGTSQRGFAGKPIIELSGRSDQTAFGLRIIQQGGVVVRGLVINRYARAGGGAAITFSGAGSNRVEGCFIGTDTRGSFALPNRDGIVIESPFNTIGGSEAQAGNLISGQTAGTFSSVEGVAGGAGIVIRGESAIENLVQGNKIGTDFTGTEPLGNAKGISISEAPNNTIGGTLATAGNLISGNSNSGLIRTGVTIRSAVGTQVIGNKIGVDINGASPVPNEGPGILFAIGASGSLIARNTIAFNNDGIFGAAGGDGNVMTANSIHSNKRLGIDLASSDRRDDLPGPGVTRNDGPGDLDDGPNRLQNFPILTAVRDANGNCRIRGVLESAPNTTFRIEFFANRERDPSGHGEGETFRGFTMVTTGPDGRVEFESALASDAGPFISATATDPTGNTSEFSPLVMLCPTTTVTTTADTGPGSLRIALEGGGVIEFDIPRTDSGFDSNTGTWKLLPQTPLPSVTKPTVIDGSSQPDPGGAPTPPPRIIIDGAMLPRSFPGLQFGPGSQGSVLTGVGFTNFSPFGAVIFDTGNVTISNSSFTNNTNGVGILGARFITLSNVISASNNGLGVAIINDARFRGGESNILNGGNFSDNRLEGIRISDSFKNVILNATLSGNGDGGSVVGSQATGNRFFNNVFRNNTGAGLGMASGASNTLITGNVFTGNAVGIGRSISAGQGNRFIGNLFRQQSVLGIDVGFDRLPSPADLPSLTSATQTNSTRIQGTFRGRPNATYTIEFYSNANCNPSGFGEGQFALDTVPVTTDGSGNANIDVTLDATIPAGQFVTATATGDLAGTSEFSRCVQVSGAARPDMALTKRGPASISPGERVTYTLEAKNLGQATALGVTVTDGLPACLGFIFCDASQGDCSVEGNTVTANLGSIGMDGTATVTIAARVSEACGQGLTNTARIAAASDTSAANDSSTVNTAIRPGLRIASLRLKGGSKLIVTGEGFESGAKINVIKPGGAETQINKTKFNSQTKLTGKGVVIAPGDRVVVENPDGVRSNEFVFAASG